MIKWPNKKYSTRRMLGCSKTETDEDISWNTCLVACIEAEKNERMSEKEIENLVIENLHFHLLKSYEKPINTQSSEYSLSKSNLGRIIAQAIHTALYGETKIDKTICEHIFSGGVNDSSRCLICGKFWKDIEWINGDTKPEERKGKGKDSHVA